MSAAAKIESITPTVVVIDDEPALLNLVSDLLEDDGYTVLQVKHPNRMDVLKEGDTPDLFLVDLMMPDKNGIQLARELRAKGMDRTPMIAMSASRHMLDQAAESRLFDDCVSKPFDLDLLLERIEHYICRRGTSPGAGSAAS